MSSFSFDCFSKQWIQYIMSAIKENGLGGKPEQTDKMPYEILKFLHQNEDTAHTLMVFLGHHFWKTQNNAEYRELSSPGRAKPVGDRRDVFSSSQIMCNLTFLLG